MRVSAVRWAVVVGVVLLGGSGGVVVARAFGPSNAEVRAAARSLVPPGGQVVEETAAHQGSFPAPGPYVAGIGVTAPGGSPGDRAASADANARVNGWDVVRRSDRPGAIRFELRRDGLVATVSVRTFEDVVTLSVQRDGRANSTRRSVGMAVGALVGLAAGAAVLATGRR